MKIKEVIQKERDNDRTVSIRMDSNGIPYELIVWYSSGTNQMALPHEVGVYHQTIRGWERDD